MEHAARSHSHHQASKGRSYRKAPNIFEKPVNISATTITKLNIYSSDYLTATIQSSSSIHSIGPLPG